MTESLALPHPFSWTEAVTRLRRSRNRGGVFKAHIEVVAYAAIFFFTLLAFLEIFFSEVLYFDPLLFLLEDLGNPEVSLSATAAFERLWLIIVNDTITYGILLSMFLALVFLVIQPLTWGRVWMHLCVSDQLYHRGKIIGEGYQAFWRANFIAVFGWILALSRIHRQPPHATLAGLLTPLTILFPLWLILPVHALLGRWGFAAWLIMDRDESLISVARRAGEVLQGRHIVWAKRLALLIVATPLLIVPSALLAAIVLSPFTLLSWFMSAELLGIMIGVNVATALVFHFSLSTLLTDLTMTQFYRQRFGRRIRQARLPEMKETL